MMDETAKNVVTDKFSELQNLSTQYPELIYDGPFSDGQLNREIKGLSGEEISKRDAEKIFTEIFAQRGVSKVKCTGEVAGKIECFSVQGEVKEDIVYAQISQKGGKLIMFEFAGSCKDVKFDQDYAIIQGKTFLDDLGIKDMEAVWVNLANNVYTINFAYTKNDVTVYPDLIKVRVCAETGGVIGIEASSYYTNHTERDIGSPKIDKNTAKSKVLDGIEILRARLSVVPIGTKTEKLCYEFSGEMDGETYYVYIDAVSGRQVEMFKVIESTEGSLLI
jgi:germination protein YpeB